ncbi:tetratricopeptide repeat protein [Stieleria sp. ICT_E10.1]|uniref:type VI secretion system accessory protein TagJ n=1 Tax=Stieleria sedimenti TaxID=2976331 RepID=UPI0021800AD5|nr:type VI secretion system accessory protein TagJ [Stieleria sedimenti]MCS7466685.1 tetratricopeptide repeat protein [Stieleria sedimenti]
MTNTPMELYEAGRLDEAVDASLAMVKAKPADVGLRFQLAELSCIAGNFERADKQLDTVTNQDPQAAIGAALLRQLVRAELARRECFFKGRVPEFLGEPSDKLKAHLQALTLYRSGDVSAAAAALQPMAEIANLNQPIEVNGNEVDEIRDLDDLLSPVLEVHTTTGKYFWVDWNQILEMEIHPPKRPFDLLWRQASLSIESGPDGEVYLPAIYLEPEEDGPTDANLQLGRGTDWADSGQGIVRGRGQKMLLAGDQDLPIMELQTIRRGE